MAGQAKAAYVFCSVWLVGAIVYAATSLDRYWVIAQARFYTIK